MIIVINASIIALLICVESHLSTQGLTTPILWTPFRISKASKDPDSDEIGESTLLFDLSDDHTRVRPHTSHRTF